MNNILGILILSIILISTNQTQNCETDFKEDIEYNCKNYYEGETGGTCKLIDNTCKEVYSQCSQYTGKNADVCKGITPHDGSKYLFEFNCKLEGDTCTQSLKECKDLNIEYCHPISDGVNTKDCHIIDGECKEITKLECSDDTLDSKEKCEKNIPPSFTKCVWKKAEGATTESCIDEPRLCKDFIEDIAGLQCNTLMTEDPNKDSKECIYDSTRKICFENYKKCENADLTTPIDESTCKSIKPVDSSKIIKSNYACVWEAQTEGATKTCFEKYIGGYTFPNCEYPEENNLFDMTEKICREIKLIGNYGTCSYKSSPGAGEHKCNTIKKKCSQFESSKEDTCKNIIPYFTKKCVLSGKDCLENNKSCSELSSEAGVTKEICESASSSQSKKCSIKSDGSGCEEVDIPKESSASQANDGEDNQTSSTGNLKSKSILVLLFLLFL